MLPLQILSSEELALEMNRRPGLIPVDIDIAGRQIVWEDLDTFHCYEGFFYQSLQVHRSLSASVPVRFLSDLDSSPAISTEHCLPPGAFIFHTGRCGSTLLAKALARSRGNIVFSEVAAHNRFWKPGWNGGPFPVDAYRAILTLMGRRRLPTYRSHVIKFTSFNILHYEAIRAAFPDVPALFLFREPGSILESYRRNQPQWMKHRGGDKSEGVELALESFLERGSAIRDPLFRRLDYARLTANALPPILDYLGIAVPPDDERLMENEFLWDSKASILAPSRFQSRAPAPPAPPRVAWLYDIILSMSDDDWR